MSYVDAIYRKEAGEIAVVERNQNGDRVYRTYPAVYRFYYPDPNGKYTSINGEPLTKVQAKSAKEFYKEKKIHSNKKLHESDLNQAFICLSEHYLNATPPKLNIAFWDIETDFDPIKGFSSPEDAFMPITAISVYLQWLDTMVTMAVPPCGLSIDHANVLISDIPNTVLFETEAEMLDYFLYVIDNVDVLSGWNCTGYDVPYTHNRIKKVLSKDDTRRLCLWNEFPKERNYVKYGKASTTYDLIGRINLDYLELYQKYTYEEKPSYKLDFIGEYEVGERKVEYEGTLDQLYNNDFRKFIEYNRQDTALLNKLDVKLKFIEVANVLAHANTVLLSTTMGAVAVSEQAIINEAHLLGLQLPDRTKANEDELQAAGAYVAHPIKGLHRDIGAFDIKSLYPSDIRACNMSPETIIGQVRQTDTDAYIDKKMNEEDLSFADAWEGMFGSLEYEYIMNKDAGKMVTIDWEDKNVTTLSAAEAYRLIFNTNQPMILSANGTIFTYEKEGVIPGLLKKWYSEREVMQATLKKLRLLEDGIDIPISLLNDILVNLEKNNA